MSPFAAKTTRLASIALLLSVVATPGGCPPATGGSSPVTAAISITATEGPAPLRVEVSASGSVSKAGAISGYAWDFGGKGSASTSDAVFTFTTPGRYTVTLTVTDEAGNVDTDSIVVQAQGGPASATITATPSAGIAPLTVRFASTLTADVGDTAYDYQWDFDDGETTQKAEPAHVFTAPGQYNVTLRLITAGGSEANASTTVTVTKGADASLQFGVGQFATLPISAQTAMSKFTFETWVSPDNDGGVLASFGTPTWSVEAVPASSIVRLRAGAQSFEVSVPIVAGRWQHVAIAYDSASGVTFYLNGAAAANAAVNGTLSVDSLRIGGGLRGKLARVRFWNTTRSAIEISGNYNRDLTGTPVGLLGDWALREGSGQALANGAGGAGGTLGATAASEASDPAWSADAP